MSGGVFNLLPGVITMLGGVPEQLVDKAATAIMQQAQMNAPIDTGFLQSSIYTVTTKSSTYGQGVLEPPEDSYLLDPLDTPPKNTAYVGVAANYGIFVELGTRFMGAEPYLVPAAETVMATLQDGSMLQQLLAEGLAAL